MNDTAETKGAVRLGDTDAMARLQERLADKLAAGLEPSTEDPRGESPEDYAERMAQRRQRIVNRWENRLPVMYRGATLPQLGNSEGARIVQRFAASLGKPDGPQNLVLAGPVGVGKTHAAYAVGNHAIYLAEKSAECWTVVDLLEAMRPNGDASAAEWVKRTDLLVLDDLGAGGVTDWGVEQMTSLMDTRLREGRRTVVTTNLTEPQLQEAWGGRFMDRLRHRMAAAVLAGPSRRTPAW